MTKRYFGLCRRVVLLTFLLTFTLFSFVGAQVLFSSKDSTDSGIDSTVWLKNYKLHARDTVGYFPNNELFLQSIGSISSVDMGSLKKVPYGDINQMIKGRVTGVQIQIPSAEPGKRNAAFVRGFTSLLLNNADVMNGQPTYIVDGIPLILDHPFAYDIQRFDVNRLGTENNLLSFIDVNDIKSIEVLKDFEAGAKYGPLAANGIIRIQTYGPRSGKLRVTVNSHITYSLKPQINTVNGSYERDFRKPFYDKYAGVDQLQNFPAYLADSTRPEFYGPANWDDLYFKNSISDGIQAAISGGSRLANFRFSVGQSSMQGVRDATGFNRYNVNFGINIMPVHNLLITTYLSGATMNRERNRFIRDRIGDEDYVMNLESPPSPNSDFLKEYYFYLGQQLDKNKNNNIRALANVQYTFSENLKINSRMGIDYDQNFRDLFIPSTVNDGNNFVSNFDGFNKRIIWDNAINFNKTFSRKHHFSASLGMYTQWDKWNYKYAKAYKGKSDYIKIYQPGTTDDRESTSNNFRLTANYIDLLKSNLASFYGNLNYDYKNNYFLGLYLREDGSSNIPTQNRWLFSPTVSVGWMVSNEPFLAQKKWLSQLKLRADWGRVGKPLSYDYYKAGPVYNVEMGWDGTPNISTYDAFPVLNASYQLGYVTEGIRWPYVEQGNIGVDIGLFQNRISLSLDVYSREYKDLLLKVPVMEEEGYTGVVKNGMSILNKGYEVTLSADVIKEAVFSWTTTLSAYANSNKLTALPDGYKDIILDDRRFVVGQRVDAYWVLINEGIYSSEKDIPINPETNRKIAYQGNPIEVGDPKWEDTNKDYVIDDEDRVLRGSLSPLISGRLGNSFVYKNISLNLLFNYSYGAKLLNQDKANHFDFVNRQGADDLSGVKEVNFWQKHQGDYSKIPLYDPWGAVNPYQVNQSLFLEDASFIKLRSVSVAYDFKGKTLHKLGIEQLRIYASASNLWMWTKYDGGDPEAASYFGYDEGYYNWTYPKSFTLGFNFRF